MREPRNTAGGKRGAVSVIRDDKNHAPLKRRRREDKMNRKMMAVLACCLIALAAAPPAMGQEKTQVQKVIYTCPMDRDVRNAAPGKCPKCGMDLRATEPESQAAESSAKETPPAAGSEQSVQVPDTAVYDQDGKKLHFYTDLVKGKTVAINFIFTTCTTICPPLTATFRRVQQSLGERVGKDIRLISVSVDPTVDTPERMKSFAEKFHAEPGWTFVTGDKSNVDQLLGALGALVANKNDHTPLVLVGNDPAGYWTRAYGLAPAPVIAKVITEAAQRKPGITE